jgi:NADP-dependent 3-hydroxy acid dehydrogenase YdfG
MRQLPNLDGLITQRKEITMIILPLGKSHSNQFYRNFAGIGGRSNLIVDGDTGDFQNVMDVNVTGSYLCTKYQMNQMLKQDTTTMQVLASVVITFERVPGF